MENLTVDFKEILKAIGAKEKPERKDALCRIAEEAINWSLEDKTETICHIGLTKYQLHWLMWRIKVHLRSYEPMEWSEMKQVLEQILVMLEKEWEKCQQPSTAAPCVEEISMIHDQNGLADTV